MSEPNDLFVSGLIGIVHGYLSGDPEMNRMLHSAEYRRAVEARYEELLRETAQYLLQLEAAGDEAANESQKRDIVPDDIVHMVVDDNRSAGKDAMKEIKRWLRGAENITVVDPYLLHFNKAALYATPHDYVMEVCELIPDSAKKVRIFGTGYTSDIKAKFRRELRPGRVVEFVDTTRIHDRIILRDDAAAKMIGTSFGGFGRKLFAVLDFPKDDISALKEVLNEIEANP